MAINLTKREKLILSLLFSKKPEFNINIEEYCNIENRSDFREEIRTALKRGNISITDDKIIHLEEKIIWKITIKQENAVVKKHK